jgi:hypothetical protein
MKARSRRDLPAYKVVEQVCNARLEIRDEP